MSPAQHKTNSERPGGTRHTMKTRIGVCGSALHDQGRAHRCCRLAHSLTAHWSMLHLELATRNGSVSTSIAAFVASTLHATRRDERNPSREQRLSAKECCHAVRVTRFPSEAKVHEAERKKCKENYQVNDGAPNKHASLERSERARRRKERFAISDLQTGQASKQASKNIP